MKYAFTCPAPGCGHTMTVEADNNDQAIDLLMLEGDKHMPLAHANMPPQPADQLRTMVKIGMKRLADVKV